MTVKELALPQRSPKPRRRGITSMIDFGPDTFGWSGGERGIADLLDVAADYIDYAKIYAMNALLIPGDVVKRTTKLYLDAGVMPFAGGILFEYAWHRNEVDGLIALLKRLAIPCLEISENYVTLSDDERQLADISRHLCPTALGQELAQLAGSVDVHITHIKPGEMDAVMAEIILVSCQGRGERESE
jgi:phosphosulfolactate synthase (CoM biosynthesis protein A)